MDFVTYSLRYSRTGTLNAFFQILSIVYFNTYMRLMKGLTFLG